MKKYGFEILIMDKEIKYLLEEIKDTKATKKEQEEMNNLLEELKKLDSKK